MSKESFLVRREGALPCPAVGYDNWSSRASLQEIEVPLESVFRDLRELETVRSAVDR